MTKNKKISNEKDVNSNDEQFHVLTNYKLDTDDQLNQVAKNINQVNKNIPDQVIDILFFLNNFYHYRCVSYYF